MLSEGTGACGGSGAWQISSDRRLKERIEDLPPDEGLSAVMQLRPVTFHWRDVKRDGAQGVQIGFIAQEIEQVFPSIVREGAVGTVHLGNGKTEEISGTKTVAYDALVVPLVKAVQELKADNDNLRLELKAANDNHLKDRVDLDRVMRELQDLKNGVGFKRAAGQ